MPKKPSQPDPPRMPDRSPEREPQSRPGILYSSLTDLRGFSIGREGTALGVGGARSPRESSPSDPPPAARELSPGDDAEIDSVLRNFADAARQRATTGDPSHASPADTAPRGRSSARARRSEVTSPDLVHRRRAWTAPVLAACAASGLAFVFVLGVRRAGLTSAEHVSTAQARSVASPPSTAASAPPSLPASTPEPASDGTALSISPALPPRLPERRAGARARFPMSAATPSPEAASSQATTQPPTGIFAREP